MSVQFIALANLVALPGAGMDGKLLLAGGLAEPRLKFLSFCRFTLVLLLAAASVSADGATRADILRGAYGAYRANNDLLFYHLDIRVDPEKKFLQGKNTIRFRDA